MKNGKFQPNSVSLLNNFRASPAQTGKKKISISRLEINQLLKVDLKNYSREVVLDKVCGLSLIETENGV